MAAGMKPKPGAYYRQKVAVACPFHDNCSVSSQLESLINHYYSNLCCQNLSLFLGFV